MLAAVPPDRSAGVVHLLAGSPYLRYAPQGRISLDRRKI